MGLLPYRARKQTSKFAAKNGRDRTGQDKNQERAEATKYMCSSDPIMNSKGSGNVRCGAVQLQVEARKLDGDSEDDGEVVR